MNYFFKIAKRIIFIISCVALLPVSVASLPKQMEIDLSYFKQNPTKKEELESFYRKNKDWLYLSAFKIQNQKVYVEDKRDLETQIRVKWLFDAIVDCLKYYEVPDTTFYVTMHDALSDECILSSNGQSYLPIWSACKKVGEHAILHPDGFALAQTYQIIEGINIENTWPGLAWKDRKNQLTWRGSSVYHGFTSMDNLKDNARITLCDFSNTYPEMIDAGLIFVSQTNNETEQFISKNYLKGKISWDEFINSKYQIWLDGNVTAYSNSGWRFYSGSTVLKPQSEYIQWYFADLIPAYHYIPVREDLKDLMMVIRYLNKHPKYAEDVGVNGRRFAQEHISYARMLEYLALLLRNYAEVVK